MNQSRKRAEPALLQNINFKRPKKEQIVPAEINNKVHPETHFSLSASSLKLQELNLFPANVPIMEKAGSWFLLAKCVKDTCGRVTF